MGELDGDPSFEAFKEMCTDLAPASGRGLRELGDIVLEMAEHVDRNTEILRKLAEHLSGVCLQPHVPGNWHRCDRCDKPLPEEAGIGD